MLQNLSDKTLSVVLCGSLSLFEVFCPCVTSNKGVFVVDQYDWKSKLHNNFYLKSRVSN